MNKWAFMARLDVPSDIYSGELHFTRWRVVQTPLGGLYLHRFDNPDAPYLHDHPWPFLSVILTGGYWEARDYSGRQTRIRRFNFKRATSVHYIADLLRKPTWTLVLVGRRRRDWGFVSADGRWTFHRDHVNNTGGT